MSDYKVLELKKIIDAKEAELGVKPKPNYKSNLKVHSKNILVMDIYEIINNISKILEFQDRAKRACHLVGHDFEDVNTYEDQLQDLILRGKILTYDKKKKGLDSFKAKLDELRSEELKKSDALSELEELLK